MKAKAEVEVNWESLKWSKIKEKMEGMGTEKHTVEALKKKFQQIQSKDPDAVKAAVDAAAGTTNSSETPARTKSKGKGKAAATPLKTGDVTTNGEDVKMVDGEDGENGEDGEDDI